MGIEPAEWREILEVLHETYEIWSPGLSRDEYYQYIARQMRQPWSRKNYRYFVLKNRGRVAASAKFYSIELAARGKIYRFCGLGAIYTQRDFRGHGYAQRVIRGLLDLARAEGHDGAMLFSDIGPSLYEKFGFVALGGGQFAITLPTDPPDEHREAENAALSALSALEVRVEPLEDRHVTWLCAHHQRWLRRRPFGVVRSEEYWKYKLGRELYLHRNSRWQWPRLEVLTIEHDSYETGYAIIEYSAVTLRVLEVVGPEATRTQLWRHILALALRRQVKRVRGWEGVCPEFLRRQAFSPREWGSPMILPIARATESWTEVNPCPVLELDHL